MKKNSVLIICHTFPPDKGIGGKRWSKFAKYLSRDNYDIHIITKKKSKSKYLNKKLYGIENTHIYEIGGFYPSILAKNPNNTWEKIKYNFWIRCLPLFHKGSIYDKSIFMKASLSKKMAEIINQFNIKLVFVTCAPFSLAYYAGKLKGEFGFFLTVDFRDPWTWGEGYGYSIISNKRKLYDKKREKKVVEMADLIISPATDILNHLSSVYPHTDSKKYHCVPHGIDIESIDKTKQHDINSHNKQSLKCVYAGALYVGYSVFFEKLLYVLKRLKVESPITYGNFLFDIYRTTESKDYHLDVKEQKLEDKIKIHYSVHETELFNKLIDYDCSIIYFPERYKNFISTKFHELIYLRVPILYIGTPGAVSEYITNNSLGEFVDIKDFENTFIDKLNAVCKMHLNTNFKIKDYSFKMITKKLMRKIEGMR